MDSVKIPFGYKRVHSHSQKGDGRWNAATGKFEKVKKEYPFIRDEQVVIRKCEVVQAELAVTPEAIAALDAVPAINHEELLKDAKANAAEVPTMDLE